jgi:predicted oxidoreductase
MEDFYKSGKAKAIGVANWSIPYLEELLADEVTRAIVRGRVAQDALEIGHAGNLGGHWNAAEGGGHDDV